MKPYMENGSMKKRIFVSNTLMVIVTLAVFLVLNLFIIKLYWHSAETELRVTAGQIVEAEDPGEMLEEWMIHQDKFLILFGIDGVLCIFILVAISQIFTGKLTRHIMEPLELLADGAERIRNNELTQDIQYSGDAEFEEVCNTFNSMRASLRQEQEKNHKYEKARTDMIAGISHDLRTPLTAIKGTVKGLLDGVAETPEQQQIFLRTAYRRTGEMEILLDLMLPGKSGYEVCREIRDEVDIPILMVTARTESLDKIRGLGAGADDYIAKPFDPAELVARVHANLRQQERAQRKSAGEQEEAPEEIRIHDLRILVNSWKVYKNGEEIKFPNREFELLKFLAMHPNVVFSKEQLFEKIWGYDYIGDSATVMVHINRIGEKIEDDSKNPKILETVWGAGYRFNK